MDLPQIFNLQGMLFAIIIAVPHIVFARTRTYNIDVIDNRAMLYIERVGKYASLILMAINIGVLEGGFTSELMAEFWFLATSVMVFVYVVLWIVFLKKESKMTAYILTVLTAIIFTISGLLQVKTLLLTAGIIYIIGEFYVLSKIFPKNKRWK